MRLRPCALAPRWSNAQLNKPGGRRGSKEQVRRTEREFRNGVPRFGLLILFFLVWLFGFKDPNTGCGNFSEAHPET